MRQLVWAFLLIFSFSSCDNKNEKVLSDRKLEDILFELYQADALTQIDYTSLGVHNTKKELLVSILDRYDVTLQQYDSTILWYSQNSDRYYKIYDNISKRIEKKEQLNNIEIDRAELLTLSPKGDSVILNKQNRSIKLSRSSDSYNLAIYKDKHFENLELFRLNFIVSVLKHDTLFAELYCNLKDGSVVSRIDTMVNPGVRSLQITVGQDLNYVKMSFRSRKVGYNDFPLWVNSIEFIRVHIDSARLN